MNRSTLFLGGKVIGLVALALAVTLVVHSIGGQSLLTLSSFFVTIVLGIPGLIGSESKLDFSLDVNRTVEQKHNQPMMDSSSSNLIEWTESPQENLQRVNSHPNWRKNDESEYDQWRNIGSVLYRASNKVRGVEFINKSHLRVGLTLTVVTGCSWFLIILIEVFASSSVNLVGFSMVAEISPLNYSMRDFPVFQIMASAALFLIPLGYLDWKTGTMCDECDTPFSLRSKGRYWHPDLKEEKMEDGSMVTIYHGVRFRECENCDKIYQDANYSWRASN